MYYDFRKGRQSRFCSKRQGKSGKGSRGSVLRTCLKFIEQSSSKESSLSYYLCRLYCLNVFQGGLSVPLPSSKSWVCVRRAIPVAHAQAPVYSDVGLDDELSSLSRATETVEYMSWRAVKDGQVVGRFPFVFTPFTCRENRSSRERCYPELQNQAHSIGYPRLLLFLSTLDLHQIVLRTSCASADHG